MKSINLSTRLNVKSVLVMYLITLSTTLFSCKKSNLTNLPTSAQNQNSSSSSLNSTTLAANNTTTIPAVNNNKVAYYTFDATPTGTPKVQLSLTNFAPAANVVIVFEGSCWELADTAHYGYAGSPMTSNYYKNYSSIIKDIRVLQGRGVKVLINVDDASSWNTTVPFKTYNNQSLNYQQFAAFVNTCVYTTLQLDGIALDVEHLGSTAANANYTNLVTEFGKYFGPLSSSPTTTMYTAAIYDGGQAGFAIGQVPAVAKYMNFVMDQGYFEDNTTRFNRWASYIGAAKTMIALSKDYNSLASGIAAAQYQPTAGSKAGIAVYAGNVDSAYCNPVFRSLVPGSTPLTGAVFYQDTQYGGTATKVIPKGSYTSAQLQTYNFVKKWASSAQIPSGWTVTMYSGDNFTGTSWVLTSSNYDFTKLSPSANDIVTSIKIN